MLGGFQGVEVFATKMMKKEMEKLDLLPIGELDDIITIGDFYNRVDHEEGTHLLFI